MIRYRRTLGSLDGLVFFEAAARHLNFTRAAEELYVTQAAVSKRIQNLETVLGIPLFQRNGRTLSLTEEGEALSKNVSISLEFMDSAVQSVLANSDADVRICANSAVSLFWLQPRVKAFSLSDDSCPVGLSMVDRLSDQLSSDGDLAIVYTDGNLPGWNCVELFEEHLLPMASPKLVGRSTSGFDFPIQVSGIEPPPLLNYPRIGPESNNWETWQRHVGAKGVMTHKIRDCPTYAHTIGRALEGQGIALGSVALVEKELSSGLLCCLGDQKLVSPYKYFIAYPKTKPLRPSVEKFLNYLVDEADRQASVSQLVDASRNVCVTDVSSGTQSPNLANSR